MVMELGLERVTIHNERVEDVEPGRFPHLEWITLQAVRPEKTLLEALRSLMSSTTTIVWITSIDKPPVPTARKVAVPESRTLAWLFQ
jgi:16S rRNA G527 N7-methylase RsmG